MQNTKPAHRKNKRAAIAEFFSGHLNQPLSSAELHIRFGSSLRARISELNRDTSSGLLIKNHTYCTAGGEISTYTAVVRTQQPTLFDTSMRHRDDN